MSHYHHWVLKIIEGSFRAGKRSNHIGYRFWSLWSMSTTVGTALSGLCSFQLVDLCFVQSMPLVFLMCDTVMHSFIQSPSQLLFTKCVCVCVGVGVWVCARQSGWPHSQSCLSPGHHITLLWGWHQAALICSCCCARGHPLQPYAQRWRVKQVNGAGLNVSPPALTVSMTYKSTGSDGEFDCTVATSYPR